MAHSILISLSIRIVPFVHVIFPRLECLSSGVVFKNDSGSRFTLVSHLVLDLRELGIVRHYGGCKASMRLSSPILILKCPRNLTTSDVLVTVHLRHVVA